MKRPIKLRIKDLKVLLNSTKELLEPLTKQQIAQIYSLELELENIATYLRLSSNDPQLKDEIYKQFGQALDNVELKIKVLSSKG